MAAGGVACIGYTGEDYAVPGHNALALETDDPQEFLDLFGTLRLNPAMERALRRAGRLTAQYYTWSRIMHSILLPRLRLIADTSHGTKITSSIQARRRRQGLPTEALRANVPGAEELEGPGLNGMMQAGPVGVR